MRLAAVKFFIENFSGVCRIGPLRSQNFAKDFSGTALL
jgi:hypothetical protein